MSFELVNTSVPKGLKPGSRGFTTVAFTEGMPANYVQLCESLSGYVHVYGLEDPLYVQNPPAYSHLIATVGGRTFSILSRVASYRKDYTGRSNKLAHHLMFKVEERTPCGPAVAMDGGRIFLEKWEEEPKYLPENRITLNDVRVGLKATRWEKTIGDAGVAGLLAQAFLDAPDRPSFIIFQPGMDLLPLMAEAQALLPEKRRWDVTFSTYFTALPVGMKCAWRCCPPKSDALVAARRTPGALVINLIDKTIEGAPSDTTLVEVARTGILKASPAEIPPPPSPPKIEVAPIQSGPPLKAEKASPRRPLIPPDNGKVSKQKPPPEKRFPLARIAIAAIVIVACGYAAFWARKYWEQTKPGLMAEKPQPVSTAPETEARSPAAVEPLEKLPESPQAVSSPKPETPTEQQPEPTSEAKPSEKILKLGHIDEGKSFDKPLSITFWDVNAVEITNAQPRSSPLDPGKIQFGNEATFQGGRFSGVPTSVAFFRADYESEQIVIFVRPVQVKFQPDSTNVILQGNDRELLKSWIVKCTNTIAANLFRGGAGFKAEVPDRESMRIVLLADQIEPWDRPVKEAESKVQNLQKRLEEAKRRIKEIDGKWKQLEDLYASANKATDKTLKDEQLERARLGYGEYIASVRQIVRRGDSFVKPPRQSKSSSLSELEKYENQRQNELRKLEQQALDVVQAENTARDFAWVMSQFTKDVEGEIPPKYIEQAEAELRRAQDSSAPTKAEILLDGRVIVEATAK